MKRRYTAAEVRARVGSLRRRLPELVLSADLMVGFPTETEQQYQDTEDLVWDLAIAYPHVFTYSARPGTPAARIPGARQVPRQVRRHRATRLRATGERIRRRVLAARVGRSDRVLIEDGGRPPPGWQLARAADYLPVYVPATEGAAGDWLEVKFERCSDHALIARAAT